MTRYSDNNVLLKDAIDIYDNPITMSAEQSGIYGVSAATSNIFTGSNSATTLNVSYH